MFILIEGERNMMKTISVLALASVFAAGSALASGYRIPEQSIDSTSKAGANISSANHADTTYFNPANMSWIDNAWQVEADLNYIHLSSIKYKDIYGSTYDGSTKEENFLAPTIFLVSPNFNNFRFGFSITEPFGLAKRWDDPYEKIYAKKYDLQVFEFNPTVSYKINKIFSVAGGVRLLYGTAALANDGSDYSPFTNFGRFVSGDATAWGYNLAVSARPNDKSNISITYRSEVDLDLEGNADFGGFGGEFTTKGKVTVVTPAVLAVSGAYTFFDKLTVELTFDRTFWSEYNDLDFTYGRSIFPYSIPFTNPVAKNWKDSNAYRLGLTYKASDMFTLMAGFAYDETPVPSETLGFELPDSNAYLFSLGARFKVTSQMDLGLGLLYDMKSSRTVIQDNGDGTVTGKFTDASALLVSAGLSYKF
jgi:long-chain fatty acid transport protein